jgi:DNA invertase Pin-like site-specific DNA recombinase
MARIGYGCISTASAEAAERAALQAAGCDRVFIDLAPGRLAKTPARDACMAGLQPGDVLVATRLARAAKSLRDLVSLAGQLRDRDIAVVVLEQGIDTTTPGGRRVFAIVVDEVGAFQKDLITEGTRAGLEAARARGRKGGRPPALSPADKLTAQAMYEQKDDDGRHVYTVQQIAGTLRVNRSTLYAHLDTRGAADGSSGPAS